jgi:hypothetical protein
MEIFHASKDHLEISTPFGGSEEMAILMEAVLDSVPMLVELNIAFMTMEKGYALAVMVSIVL